MIAGNKQKSHGFTMIELLITLGLVSILAMLAAPSFAQFIKQERLTKTANQLNAIYRYARSEAVKRAQTVILTKQDNSWLVEIEVPDGREVLRQFDSIYPTVNADLVDRMIRSTGELNLQSNILITDNDRNTKDYRLCILQSGQSWLGKAEENCA
ncbi:GspH/FimT family pseudopilin [Pseudoalteromonas phenolica]|uniref:Type II secretion system protein H n=1 Tax=Pseudoalteromonas phenolica TaxID=161398 RepID=A0A0S2JXT3_9GAMM|nr:GspH/FimT family pseudopilin [Pseudoalteromonas phenolica]ALO40785.1 Pilin [Pseudoalteromonas phenolica]MBE0354696.1 type IV fimbrial biogenesis protein FimT [Pseudoalteromonas phenolica O-BC30]RXF04947.1 prepilin-type N-terminal cleavage/methylation domain-containing protein [Pseudoalteromonas phenolica O-BC30]